MNFLSEDIIILRVLFSKGNTDIYYFHEKYLLSPGQLARSFNKLIEMNIAQLNDDELQITDFGIKWTISNRKNIFLEEKEMFWKEVPAYMKREPLIINQMYKPKRKLLDYNYFSKIIKNLKRQV